MTATASPYDELMDALHGGKFAPALTPEAQGAVRDWDLVPTVEMIARSVLRLAEPPEIPALQPLATITKAGSFFPLPKGFEAGKRVVFFNTPPAPCARCAMPDKADILGPKGLLGLKAVVVTLDTTQHLSSASLVLPTTGLSPTCGRQYSFTAVTITLQGTLIAQTFVPNTAEPNFLARALQLAPNTRAGYFTETCPVSPALRRQLSEARLWLEDYLFQCDWQHNRHSQHTN